MSFDVRRSDADALTACEVFYMNGKKRSQKRITGNVVKSLWIAVFAFAYMGLATFCTGVSLLFVKNSIISYKINYYSAFLTVFGLAYLSLSIAVAIHLLRRSKRSRGAVRICCAVMPIGATLASLALIPAGLGKYAIMTIGMALSLAWGTRAMIEKRLEVGDDRPLAPVPGWEGPVPWRRVLLIYALAALVALAVFAIRGAMAPEGGGAAGEAEARAAAEARRKAMTWGDPDNLPPFPSHLFNPGEGGSE